MAQNSATDNAKQPTTYAVLVIFTVDRNSHENLRDAQSMRNEAASWIESLGASVQGVCVRKAG